MSKMIQIRNVPDDLHRALKAQAARDGLSLSDFLLREAKRIVTRPSLDELLERIRGDGTPRGSFDSARAVREEREGRR